MEGKGRSTLPESHVETKQNPIKTKESQTQTKPPDKNSQIQ
jgi:hypothetical protein